MRPLRHAHEASLPPRTACTACCSHSRQSPERVQWHGAAQSQHAVGQDAAEPFPKPSSVSLLCEVFESAALKTAPIGACPKSQMGHRGWRGWGLLGSLGCKPGWRCPPFCCGTRMGGWRGGLAGRVGFLLDSSAHLCPSGGTDGQSSVKLVSRETDTHTCAHEHTRVHASTHTHKHVHLSLIHI